MALEHLYAIGLVPSFVGFLSLIFGTLFESREHRCRFLGLYETAAVNARRKEACQISLVVSTAMAGIWLLAVIVAASP